LLQANGVNALEEIGGSDLRYKYDFCSLLNGRPSIDKRIGLLLVGRYL
jgi:hypothetical protein